MLYCVPLDTDDCIHFKNYSFQKLDSYPSVEVQCIINSPSLPPAVLTAEEVEKGRPSPGCILKKDLSFIKYKSAVLYAIV